MQILKKYRKVTAAFFTVVALLTLSPTAARAYSANQSPAITSLTCDAYSFELHWSNSAGKPVYLTVVDGTYYSSGNVLFYDVKLNHLDLAGAYVRMSYPIGRSLVNGAVWVQIRDRKGNNWDNSYSYCS